MGGKQWTELKIHQRNIFRDYRNDSKHLLTTSCGLDTVPIILHSSLCVFFIAPILTENWDSQGRSPAQHYRAELAYKPPRALWLEFVLLTATLSWLHGEGPSCGHAQAAEVKTHREEKTEGLRSQSRHFRAELRLIFWNPSSSYSDPDRCPTACQFELHA